MSLPSAPGSAPSSRPPRGARAFAALVGAGVIAVTPAGVAHGFTPAAVGDAVGEVTVEPTVGLPADGAVVAVTGTGFDTSAGIYVAVCVDNGPGQKPSPCIGGVDTEGQGGATWISDNPPTYAEGLTLPYGPGGSFDVELPVPMVDEVTGVDCRDVVCAVTVRYDHLRAEDRGADHVIPVTFAPEDTGAGADGAGAGGDADTEAADESPEPARPDASEQPADRDSGSEDDAPAERDAASVDTAQRDDAESPDSSPVLPVTLAGAAALLLVTLVLLQRRRRLRSVSPVSDPSRAEPAPTDDG